MMMMIMIICVFVSEDGFVSSVLCEMCHTKNYVGFVVGWLSFMTYQPLMVI